MQTFGVPEFNLCGAYCTTFGGPMHKDTVPLDGCCDFEGPAGPSKSGAAARRGHIIGPKH